MAATVKASTTLTAEKLPAKVVLQANPREFREQLGGTILPNSITLDVFIQNIEYPKYSWSYLGVSSWVAITGQTSSSLTITSGEWNARYYRVEVTGYTTSGQTIRSNQDGYDIMLIQKLPYDAALAAELDIIKSTTDKIPVSIQGSLLMGSKLFLRNPGDKNETGQENAGVNGSDVPLTNPAFWAGGAYTEAVAGEAKAIIRHDGSSKFTDTEITGTVTAGGVGSARTEINDAGIEIFNALNIMNIRFGLKNGYAVMEYYDNDGELLYDLGPNGIGQIEVREESWTEVKLHSLSTSSLGYAEALSKPEVYKNGASYPTTYYRYNSKIVAGVHEDPINNGKVFPSRDKEGVTITGIFCRATNGHFRGIAGGDYPVDYHPDNPTIFWTSLYNIWKQPLIKYIGGVIIEERYSAYWTIIREGYSEI